MDPPLPRYALGIIHFRAPEALQALVDDAASWSSPPAVVLVVDNSSDLPPAHPAGAQRAGAAAVVVHSPGDNVGYGSAANLMLEEAGRHGVDYLLLATQDCLFEPTAAATLLRLLHEDDSVGATAPLLTFRSAPGTVFSAGGQLNADATTKHHHFGQPLSRALRPDTGSVSSVDWADGAALMLRRSAAAATGGFREDFFLYVEDVEFLLRLRLSGSSVLLARDARASQEPGSYPTYLRYRNNVHFGSLHEGTLGAWPWSRELVLEATRVVRRKRRTRDLVWALRGVVDGKRGRMGHPPLRLLSA
ncbi:glycosyltransferase [Modestobacter versicolor]|uniref:glycosyltransferase n=1 Tax=Modestobacter versicolor TaxID=429133 RepID=UPI0034DE20B2